ncbi:hypothetical protein [Gordonia sp. (in: high G+C Gram-positive bacteria)]|uniref:hypothetical protein n=1 Tax=Gordonia sp. (in: high G+C Gram-positive bacteria) TaxID=84139 RepID=UPI0025C2DBD3|nr:hypothetical protein [Gordonia sp. (in: high G+C Gram-positive bacteria)]
MIAVQYLPLLGHQRNVAARGDRQRFLPHIHRPVLPGTGRQVSRQLVGDRRCYLARNTGIGQQTDGRRTVNRH